jgi:hypothetical protein
MKSGQGAGKTQTGNPKSSSLSHSNDSIDFLYRVFKKPSPNNKVKRGEGTREGEGGRREKNEERLARSSFVSLTHQLSSIVFLRFSSLSL